VKKTFVRSQKNSEKLCDFKKSWEKCDKNWNRDKQKWKHRVQTKEVNKKICPISTKLGENLSDSDKIAKNTLSDLTKIAKIPCRKKKFGNRPVRGRPEYDVFILGRIIIRYTFCLFVWV